MGPSLQGMFIFEPSIFRGFGSFHGGACWVVPGTPAIVTSITCFVGDTFLVQLLTTGKGDNPRYIKSLSHKIVEGEQHGSQ